MKTYGFSWKRLLGITEARQKIARATGIPTTRAGRRRKAGNLLLSLLFGAPKRGRRKKSLF
jgi:hypothetical protein